MLTYGIFRIVSCGSCGPVKLLRRPIRAARTTRQEMNGIIGCSLLRVVQSLQVRSCAIAASQELRRCLWRGAKRFCCARSTCGKK
jgi:hypothetical protein